MKVRLITKVHAKKRKSTQENESPLEKAKVHVSTNFHVEIKNESPSNDESPLEKAKVHSKKRKSVKKHKSIQPHNFF